MHDLRVRYQETDQMGVVYHANYLNWFEVARTEWIRMLGIPYSSIERKGLLLPVVDAELKFIKPAKYDDVVRIFTEVTEYSHVRISFAYLAYRCNEANADFSSPGGMNKSDLLVSGSTRHVWLNSDWKPVRIDKEAPELYRTINEYHKNIAGEYEI